MHGSFEKGGPHIDIQVVGMAHGSTPTTFKGWIDTGNNGYMTMSYTDAFPLGLILKGIESSILADGTVSNHFVCVGKVTIAGHEVTTTIDIYPKCNILIGTALLKDIGMEMKVDFLAQTIELIKSIPAPATPVIPTTPTVLSISRPRTKPYTRKKSGI